MESNHEAGIPTPKWRRSSDGQAAVDLDYYWQPMETCPKNTKVQLLTIGGIAIYGSWNGRDPFYTDWAPLPKRRPLTS